ncbi:MAG: hypothetical protein H7210_10180, partial [Pyrinomonadaceae bacterium]|nr:hypothetical protein [Phycisphaerales bacterium]
EQAGFIPNVVFPTGAVRDRGSLLVYYGAADECTAVAEFSEHDLLASLIRHSRQASPALGVCHRTPQLATLRSMAAHTAKSVATSHRSPGVT